MTRSLHLFNAVLGLVAIALGTGIVRTVLDRGPSVVAAPPVAALRSMAAAASGPASPIAGTPDAAAALPDEPDVLLTRHPFGKPLPEPVKVPNQPRAIPRPEPLPALIGTVIVGNQRRALLKDGSRTDLFAPGDAVAGGTLVEIYTDRVVIKRGEALSEVWLKRSIVEMRGQQGAPVAAPRVAEPGRDATDPSSASVTTQSTPPTPETESRAARRQRLSQQRPPGDPRAPAADGR